MTKPSTKPHVLILCLSSGNWINHVFPTLMTRLERQTQPYQVTNPPAAHGALKHHHWAAVLVIDEAVTNNDNEYLCKSLLEYIHKGGKAIFLGMFPGGMPSKIKKFFSRVGLDWEVEREYKATVCINTEDLPRCAINGLPSSYATRAFFLKNVERGHAWYCPAPVIDAQFINSRIVSPNVFSAVMAPCHTGKVGFVGNTSEEACSTAVILGMMDIWLENPSFGQRAPLR